MTTPSLDKTVVLAERPPAPDKPVITELKPGQFIRGRHRYKLHKRIGTGGFGTVWVAQCVEPDNDAPDVPPKVCAIKFFNAVAEFDSTEFIRRELAALLSMRSRYIPRVYDWAVNDRLSFFVMELYRHGSLADDFKTQFSLDDDETWLLLVDILRALKVAHRAGILHLDIKPANIMKDGKGSYLLLDFGISQAVQVSQGPAQTIGAGSRGYQAPEQRRMELDKLDTRTDLWAVGATAWALRTGYDLAKNPEKIRLDAKGAEPSLPPLSAECLSVSDELEELVMSMLAEDPSERPGGAAEVLERLKKATGIEVAEEPTAVQRRDHDEAEVVEVIKSVMDPLWSSLLSRADFSRFFAKFEDGAFLCREGQASYEAFLLLRGKVRIVKGGKQVALDEREGTFIGELSTLTGTPRAASIQAVGTVWVCLFNAAEFERMLAAHPAVAIRLVKQMAERLVRS
ncbi:MAG: serine/threonine-protein kinase [Gammaproteobacteria bacterium]|nr:serine/threonine-protein kinase [Gammaproteobacteria bacterium]